MGMSTRRRYRAKQWVLALATTVVVGLVALGLQNGAAHPDEELASECHEPDPETLKKLGVTNWCTSESPDQGPRSFTLNLPAHTPMASVYFIPLSGSIECTAEGLAMKLEGPTGTHLKVTLETKRGNVWGWTKVPVTIPESGTWQNVAAIDHRLCFVWNYTLAVAPD
ncbi:hypothetical protein [Streptomyces cathayae]|uniref:Lipoprotein n=1 Tax=Streptomyces cathayae TaxID=3031124 RepID=A0ABY8KEA2_9ACTN|nr:hypothetical protein [Streptomyces sp. HUAS 5]WGD45161.1 hypothetical protein PYS65_34270 [Streptomyces sp. HUAS 5]